MHRADVSRREFVFVLGTATTLLSVGVVRGQRPDPEMKVSRIALGPGYGVPALASSFDVSVGGETAESGGNAEYVLDASAARQKKGMILLGHMLSEDFGMKEVAEWLRTFVSDVPIEWVPAGEPFSAPV